MGGTYCQQGDYFLPDLAVPEIAPVGIWGQRHLRYMQKHRKAIYTAMLLSGELDNYLSKIDQQAEDTITLVAGLHRLEAAKRLGWTEIECNICTLEDYLSFVKETCANV